jgi:hypothetical protein
VIRDDWSIAKRALQVIAEQGPGLLVAQAENAETSALQPLLKLLR